MAHHGDSMTQGDILNMKKRGRRSSGEPGTAVQYHDGPSSAVHTHTAATPNAAVERVPTPPTGGSAANTTALDSTAHHQLGSSRGTTRLTDSEEFLRSQLVTESLPLPNPPPREDGGAGPSVGSYFETRAAGQSRGSPKAPPSSRVAPCSPASVGLSHTQQSYPSALMTEPVPLRPLRRGDFYYRPDLDAVSQAVVLESLAAQRREEQEKQMEVKRGREVLLARFHAQRRDRVMLALRTGLPIPPHVADEFGVASEPHERRLKKEIRSAKARKDARRNEIMDIRASMDAPRMSEARSHRSAMLATMDQRMSRRQGLESTLGTGLRTSLAGTTATLGSTIDDLIKQHACDAQAKAELEEQVGALKYLDSFDAKSRAVAKSQRRPKGGDGGEADGRPPRQRELPYTLTAPYKYQHQHRAPIVMSESEKRQAVSAA